MIVTANLQDMAKVTFLKSYAVTASEQHDVHRRTF